MAIMPPSLRRSDEAPLACFGALEATSPDSAPGALEDRGAASSLLHVAPEDSHAERHEGVPDPPMEAQWHPMERRKCCRA